MITIGQLARYAAVSIKTVRVYHAKGLLAEPERDSSGYRRYTAGQAIDLLKIRALADAGVPLARIRILKQDNYRGLPQVVQEIDADLTERIRALRRTQRRLRELTDNDTALLPPRGHQTRPEHAATGVQRPLDRPTDEPLDPSLRDPPRSRQRVAERPRTCIQRPRPGSDLPGL